jgi:carbon storage regulator CsrA
MLVLTRKLQQQIKIGEQVTITILRVKGQTVRVGIEAPRDVRVIRGELPSGDQSPAGEESAIEETTLVLSGNMLAGDAAGESEARDGASALDEPTRDEPTRDEPTRDEATAGRREAAFARSTSESPTAPRLPQRRRYNRVGSPPLRVAMSTVSGVLAK